jgi:hypothetical protein
MWLQVPDEIEDAVSEGPLEIVVAPNQRARARSGPPTELPVVSIGRPMSWSLRKIFSPEDLSPLAKASLEVQDFYLVRLACSLRPISGETVIDWARFEVELMPGPDGSQPTAFDMHPLQVMQEIKRNVKVTFSPTLKYKELEASAGSAEFGFEYTELQPVITTDGVGERQPGWAYRSANGVPLVGSKMMHLLVQAPRGMASARANLSLKAGVSRDGSKWTALFRSPEQRNSEFTVDLWSAPTGHRTPGV